MTFRGDVPLPNHHVVAFRVLAEDKRDWRAQEDDDLVPRPHVWMADSDIPLDRPEEPQVRSVKVQARKAPELDDLVADIGHQLLLFPGVAGRKVAGRSGGPGREQRPQVVAVVVVLVVVGDAAQVQPAVVVHGAREAEAVEENGAPKGLVPRLTREQIGPFVVILQAACRQLPPPEHPHVGAVDCGPRLLSAAWDVLLGCQQAEIPDWADATDGVDRDPARDEHLAVAVELERERRLLVQAGVVELEPAEVVAVVLLQGDLLLVRICICIWVVLRSGRRRRWLCMERRR